MDFTLPRPQLIELLDQQLSLPLPGAVAQAKMAPQAQLDQRFKIKPPQDARRGSVLILLYQRQGHWYFPLIQRPEYDGHHSGQVALPGGKVEPDDINLVHTALRESEEEIGVAQAAVEVLGALTDLYIPPSRFLVRPVVGWCASPPRLRADPYEVSEILETPLQDLLHPDNVQQTSRPPGVSYPLSTPYFALHDRVVWGATGMILSEFSHVLTNLSRLPA